MTYTCKRCSHTWIPRSDEKPKECPSCKSYRWDVPKHEPKKEAE